MDDRPTKRFDTKVVLAVAGTIIGIMGFLINFIRFQEEQPQVVLTLSSAVLRSPFDHTSTVRRLEQIEDQFGSVTSTHINDLISFARRAGMTNPDQTLSSLLEQIQQKAVDFDREYIAPTPENVTINDGRLIFPDGSALAAPPETASLEERASLIRRAIDFYNLRQNRTDHGLMRQQVARDLRQLAEDIGDALVEDDKRIEIVVAAENTSRLPSQLRPNGLIRVVRDKRRFVDVPLRLATAEGNGFLRETTISEVRLQTDRMDELRSNDRAFIKEAFNRQDACVIVLEDIRGNLWHSTGHLSDAEVVSTNFLQNRAQELMGRLLEGVE